MINEKISPVGLGTYRMSVKSKTHINALQEALKLGCNLLDTSSNYTNGDSERLIGNVLENSPYNPLIITKAGYIQGANLEAKEAYQNEELVDIEENLKHSIHPDFLKHQIEQSLNRLKKKTIDIFLLHNPEYYFEKNDDLTLYYERIKKAFSFLEEMVEKGKIKSYGISSNTFVQNIESPKRTDLSKVYQAAQQVSSNNHFKAIQFPINIIEKGALNKNFDDKNLIEKAKEYKLITIGNRPFNAFTESGFFRIAEYDADIDETKANSKLEECIHILSSKAKENNIELDILSMPVMKQFIDIWDELATPDACQQVYFEHFFPLVAQIWGKSGLNPKESAPFYELYEYSESFSRRIMGQKAKILRRKLEEKNELPLLPQLSLTQLCIEQYLQWGMDHILVGMKKTNYVEQLKGYFHEQK